MRQRSALLQLQMALSLVLALTLVLALVRNIIFSKVRVLVLNQPINNDPGYFVPLSLIMRTPTMQNRLQTQPQMIGDSLGAW